MLNGVLVTQLRTISASTLATFSSAPPARAGKVSPISQYRSSHLSKPERAAVNFEAATSKSQVAPTFQQDRDSTVVKVATWTYSRSSSCIGVLNCTQRNVCNLLNFLVMESSWVSENSSFYQHSLRYSREIGICYFARTIYLVASSF